MLYALKCKAVLCNVLYQSPMNYVLQCSALLWYAMQYNIEQRVKSSKVLLHNPMPLSLLVIVLCDQIPAISLNHLF